jgi:catechol 2,3-dioxygenase-like lactoylglutathione lyase family enzyme
MKFVPLLHCRDMREAVDFYTRLLGFDLCDGDTADDVVVDLRLGKALLQLSEIDGRPNISVNVIVEDVDAIWAELRSRGFDPPQRPESPVHQGPLDQTWGSREFYLDDPSGNTLRFRSWPK